MADEKLLTIRDVSQLLGINEREVIELAERGELPAYKVAGVYLRFKREQVEEFKATFKPREPQEEGQKEYPLRDKIRDFFYFNDFYILAVVLIVLILILIFRNIE